MRRSKKNIFLIASFILLCGGGYFYKEYNRKPADISNIEPDVSANATALVELYQNDEAKANQQYLGKTIQATGVIAEINNLQDTLVNVLIGESSSMHKVSCLLDIRYLALIRNYRVGQQIIIRGICTGYLMDVEMNRCVIIEKK